MGNSSLRLHAFLQASYSNGPGRRAVIWVQGCTLGCRGCFNPETHNQAAGEDWGVERLLSVIKSVAASLEGLTVSGGEPLQQPSPLLRLLKSIRQETDLSTIVFTGYTLEEVRSLSPQAEQLLGYVDVLIAGRYNHSLRLASGLIGSANKMVHFLTSRYEMSDLRLVPEAEIIVTPEGDLMMTGINPAAWPGRDR